MWSFEVPFLGGQMFVQLGTFYEPKGAQWYRPQMYLIGLIFGHTKFCRNGLGELEILKQYLVF
jgi:hypothetical protein